MDVFDRIHWATVSPGEDPFLEGAYWALSWSLNLAFGAVIGSSLTTLTLYDIERYNGSAWVPIA